MNGQLPKVLNLKFWGNETRPAIYPNLFTMMTLLNLIKDTFLSFSQNWPAVCQKIAG